MCLLWTDRSRQEGAVAVALHSVGGAVCSWKSWPVLLTVSWKGWDRFSNMKDSILILHWIQGADQDSLFLSQAEMLPALRTSPGSHSRKGPVFRRTWGFWAARATSWTGYLCSRTGLGSVGGECWCLQRSTTSSMVFLVLFSSVGSTIAESSGNVCSC